MTTAMSSRRTGSQLGKDLVISDLIPSKKEIS